MRYIAFAIILTVLSGCSTFKEKVKHSEPVNCLSSVPQEARMVPDIIPESDGQIRGFKFVSIEPGSRFDELGFQIMDVVVQIDQTILDSPSAAMEFYSSLKENRFSQIRILREGQELILNR